MDPTCWQITAYGSVRWNIKKIDVYVFQKVGKVSTWKSLSFKIGNISIWLVLENRILFMLLNILMFLKKFHSYFQRKPMKIWSFQGPWVHNSCILSEGVHSEWSSSSFKFQSESSWEAENIEIPEPPPLPGRHVSAIELSSGLICSNGIW